MCWARDRLALALIMPVVGAASRLAVGWRWACPLAVRDVEARSVRAVCHYIRIPAAMRGALATEANPSDLS